MGWDIALLLASRFGRLSKGKDTVVLEALQI